jgi:hypothetical protein
MRALAIAMFAAAALAPGAAHAATSGAEVTVTAGSLSLGAGDFQAQSAALTGAEQVLATTPAAPWSAVDARGTGASWTVVASATDLVSAGTPNRTIPSSALALTTGTITAGTGADAVTGMTGATGAAFTTPSGPGQTDVSVLAAPGPHRGAYTFTPRLDITIPASALASYVGAPYTTTLTVTIS